jgi:hypothetical protein
MVFPHFGLILPLGTHLGRVPTVVAHMCAEAANVNPLSLKIHAGL